ncbi:MAG: type IV pilus assembly protein FimV, partial [Gammaproteobacteria bacterium]
MKYKTVCLFTVNLLFCSQVFAINLGKIQVNSALNEPFQAQVPILNVTESDINTVNAKIAENYAFLNARMERKPIINNIKLGLQQDKSGQYSISLSSDASVNDLFLEIILDVDANQERLSREYTVLLDPKGYNPHKTKRIPKRTVKTFKPKQKKIVAKASHSMESSIGHESHDMKGSVESHSMESSIGSDSHDMKGSVEESHSMESSIGSDSHDMKGSVEES